MASVFTRMFDITFKDGTTTKAMIVSNGDVKAKPKMIVEHDGAKWRYRKQLVDKNTGEELPEFMYIQDNSVNTAEPSAFFQVAA
jgi:hypothetical protein